MSVGRVVSVADSLFRPHPEQRARASREPKPGSVALRGEVLHSCVCYTMATSMPTKISKIQQTLNLLLENKSLQMINFQIECTVPRRLGTATGDFFGFTVTGRLGSVFSHFLVIFRIRDGPFFQLFSVDFPKKEITEFSDPAQSKNITG